MTKNKDKYYTIEKKERAELKVKSSRFIATANHVVNKDEAMEFLNSIRKEFHDATHNCFAYRFGDSGLEFRSSDDGEPSGSSGKPILFTIQKYDVSDVIVVVTRYFGGTKLGIGGLARAYSEAASMVLSECIKKEVYKTQQVRIFCVYEDLNVVKKIIDSTAVSYEEYYADAIEFVAKIPISEIEEFCLKIQSMTNGRAGTQIR